MGSRRHNFRHLQHSCSSLEEVLLIFLEDIARNNPSYWSFLKPWPQNKSRRAAQKICGPVVRRANKFSTLHESRIVLKTGQYEKTFLPHMTASRSSVALNYFRTGWRILFTTFLETKTQPWKLM